MNSCCLASQVPFPFFRRHNLGNPLPLMPQAARHVAILVVILLLGGCTANARGAPDSFAFLVKKVLPSVVNIAVTEAAPNRDMLKDLPPELRDTPLGREFRRRF